METIVDDNASHGGQMIVKGNGIDENNTKINDSDSSSPPHSSSSSSSFIDACIFASSTAAIHIAAQSGHLDIIETLASRGADLNAADAAGWTPLHLGVDAGHVTAVKRLLELGVRDDLISEDGYSPYSLAKNVEMKKLLRNKVKELEGDTVR